MLITSVSSPSRGRLPLAVARTGDVNARNASGVRGRGEIDRPRVAPRACGICSTDKHRRHGASKKRRVYAPFKAYIKSAEQLEFVTEGPTNGSGNG